jgi:hypothetical protein
VNYVFQKAAAMGKKAVVNMSWSSGFGPRDGSGSLDAGISALCGPGKLISVAAGNFGNIGVHGRSTWRSPTTAISCSRPQGRSGSTSSTSRSRAGTTSAARSTSS